MLWMKKLSYDYKLPGRSIPEVHDLYEAALVAHQKGRSILFNGRKLSGEALVNAVMLHFLSLEHEQQRGILTEFVPRFEALLVEAEPAVSTAKKLSPKDMEKADEPVAIAGRDESEADLRRRQAGSGRKTQGQRERPKAKGKPRA